MTYSLYGSDADITIAQGSSVALKVGVKGVTNLANTTCYMQVRNYTTNTVTGLEGVVSTKNLAGDRYLRTLTAVETGALSIGRYSVGFEITNTLTSEVGESIQIMDITKQRVVIP